MTGSNPNSCASLEYSQLAVWIICLANKSCTAGKVLPDMMELVWEDDLTSYVTDENENGGTAATPSGTISERVHGESQKTIAELAS